MKGIEYGKTGTVLEQLKVKCSPVCRHVNRRTYVCGNQFCFVK